MSTNAERSRSDGVTRSVDGTLRVALMATAVAAALGVLTAYAQGWLPEQMVSIANSSGSWALVAFLLAMLAPRSAVAALVGSLSLAALLAGYVLGASARGFPSSTGVIVFWGAAAVLVGPALGLSGSWVKHSRGPRAALGAGAMSGVLVGEGAYGLAFVAETTYPPYWWGSIAAGLVLLVLVMAAHRLPSLRDRALAGGVCAVVAVAFVAVYSQGSDLFSLLS